MDDNVSLFSGYNQRENRTTNYCLLLLKSLYEASPKYLAEILATLIDHDFSDLVGIRFRQQQKREHSTPDGLICQRAFTIFVETKRWDWFYDSQLEAHLKELDTEQPGKKILIALGNFDSTTLSRFERIRTICSDKYHKRIVFASVSFSDLLRACKNLGSLSKIHADMIADFERYLSEEGLLSSWEHLLDVVNCAGIPDEVVKGNVYMCPAKSGAYNHTRSKFFGMYKDKKVQFVARIEAVVVIHSEDKAMIQWSNTNSSDETSLISIARGKHTNWRPREFPTRVFVLGPLAKTEFHKGTKWGLRGNKRYFDISALNPVDEEDLARKLQGKDWPLDTWMVKP